MDASLNLLSVDGTRASELLSSRATAGIGRDELARRIGRLLATLRAPDTAERQGTTPVRRAYLEHWRAITRVWLGGGQVAGLPDLDVDADVEVRVADDAALLPLVGAARAASETDGRVAVLDCGHTAIKRGIATVAGGALVRLEVLAPMPAPPDAAAVTPMVEGALDATVAAGADGVGPVSVASYIGSGAALDTRSIYRVLGIDVELLHDGTAAAMAIADPTPAAVVMLGSFLGVGFVPQTRPLLPMADGFAPVRPDPAR